MILFQYVICRRPFLIGVNQRLNAFNKRLNLRFERTQWLFFNEFPFVIRTFPGTRYALILRSHLGE